MLPIKQQLYHQAKQGSKHPNSRLTPMLKQTLHLQAMLEPPPEQHN
jgi:hypothetical protein